MKSTDLKFATKAIHIGNTPDIETGAISPAIHLTTTFEQDRIGQDRGYDYARAGNPTRERWEANVAALEGGKYGLAFASGMAAITTLFQSMHAGDHVLISHNVYGGTYRVVDQVLKNHGIDFDFINLSDISKAEAAINPNTKLIFAETPTNPLLELVDLEMLADVCHQQQAILAVDNTFLSPYGQRPLENGADVVVHSATKYLGGHSDVIGGVLVTSNDDLHSQFRMIQKSVGAVPNSFDCWLLIRSTKTLEVRVTRSAQNAQKIAGFLQNKANLNRVIYPGLDTHPQKDLASRQQQSPDGKPFYGSIISIEFLDLAMRDRFLSKLEIFKLAESLGGVESLISNPYVMTHGAVPVADKRAMGLTEGLVRLSIGIEAVDDLLADLDRALS